MGINAMNKQLGVLSLFGGGDGHTVLLYLQKPRRGCGVVLSWHYLTAVPSPRSSQLRLTSPTKAIFGSRCLVFAQPGTILLMTNMVL